MLVIADATPLIALSDVGLLHLLDALYKEVIIPPAVEREAFLLRNRPMDSWIQVVAPTPPLPKLLLGEGLGAGETEAIALALQRHADLLLVDDRRGRAVALRSGLPVAGTIAVLLHAKEAGLIPAVKSVLDALISKGLRVSSRLYASALRTANE